MFLLLINWDTMALYELVVVCDVNLSQVAYQQLKKDIENVLGKGIKDTDDMWLQQFHHEMTGKRYLNQWFMVSYYVELQTDALEGIQKWLTYEKTIIRHVLYAMMDKQKYFKFDEIAKEVEPFINAEDWSIRKRITLFDDKKGQEYFVRKAVPLLKKFMTRFGDIKPRKYTGISVKQQKMMRIAIMRGRELGVLPYIK